MVRSEVVWLTLIFVFQPAAEEWRVGTLRVRTCELFLTVSTVAAQTSHGMFTILMQQQAGTERRERQQHISVCLLAGRVCTLHNGINLGRVKCWYYCYIHYIVLFLFNGMVQRTALFAFVLQSWEESQFTRQVAQTVTFSFFKNRNNSLILESSAISNLWLSGTHPGSSVQYNFISLFKKDYS